MDAKPNGVGTRHRGNLLLDGMAMDLPNVLFDALGREQIGFQAPLKLFSLLIHDCLVTQLCSVCITTQLFLCPFVEFNDIVKCVQTAECSAQFLLVNAGK